MRFVSGFQRDISGSFHMHSINRDVARNNKSKSPFGPARVEAEDALVGKIRAGVCETFCHWRFGDSVLEYETAGEGEWLGDWVGHRLMRRTIDGCDVT